jgi:precorrin-4/cobalt-precorrin-4 C11-methyltransferase
LYSKDFTHLFRVVKKNKDNKSTAEPVEISATGDEV